MDPEKLKVLRELLGEGFTQPEIEEMARQDPGLLGAAEELRGLFQSETEAEVPPLSPDFTSEVLRRLPQRNTWGEVFHRIRSLRPLYWAGAAVAALFAVVFLGRQILFPPPRVAQREAVVRPSGQKIYRVRFTSRPPQAKTVAVAGDFNQWVPQPLKQEADGSFSTELNLPEGIYTYAFVLDGQRWVPDETVARTVEDGFGGKNSLLNL